MRIEIKKEYNEVHEKRLMLFRVFFFSLPFTHHSPVHTRDASSRLLAGDPLRRHYDFGAQRLAKGAPGISV